MPVTAVVMVGADPGISEPISWVQKACRAAACDLIDQLNTSSHIDRIVMVSPSLEGLEISASIDHLQSEVGEIHVGSWLARISERLGLDRILYFGGGAAPLLPPDQLEEIAAWLAASEMGIITNNQFASDWAGITPAQAVVKWQERLPLDNMLGWVLSTEAGLPITVQPPSAASRLDIDTPTDLLALAIHPRTRPKLRAYLESLPLNLSEIQAVLQVFRQKASQVFLSGRISPEAWSAMNRVSQCWIRVLSEERGMVSSGRLERGEVFSFLADYIEHIGLERWLQILAEHSQAALIDNRVMLAHHGRWPSKADRFAADLGLTDQVHDPWLKAFSTGVKEAPLPILVGGHGLLSGDLFALADML